MKKIKQSETVTVMRSQINFAPFNPKAHTKEQVQDIVKNFKRVGYLGGIIWNTETGNLVDGHKRVQGMDLIYKYDGTTATDYEVKVEKTKMDIKTEKEQNIFQTKSRTELDDELMRDLIPDIDYKNAGLDDYDMGYYGFDLSSEDVDISAEVEEMYEPVIQQREADKEERKEKVKEAKEKIKEDAAEKVKNLDSYVTLSFSEWKNKEAFMLRLGFDPEMKMIKGESLSERIEVID